MWGCPVFVKKNTPEVKSPTITFQSFWVSECLVQYNKDEVLVVIEKHAVQIFKRQHLCMTGLSRFSLEAVRFQLVECGYLNWEVNMVWDWS